MTLPSNEVTSDISPLAIGDAMTIEDRELDHLRKQRDELNAQIEMKEKAKREEVLKLVKQACKHYGFTHQMLKGALAAGRNRQRT